MVQELLGHQAPVVYGRRTGTITLAIGDQREIDLDHVGASGFKCLASGFPEPDHRGPGVDALACRATDTGRIRRARFGVGVDVHARHAQALARQCRGIRGECLVGGRTHRGDARQGHPGLHAPQIAPGVGVLRDHHVEHFEQVRHGSGERHHNVHGGRQRPVTTYRDHPARRRIGTQAIVRGRAPTAGPGFFGQAECGETGRGGGACTVGRA
ncbi:hypothetical protein D3C84_730290 [compost metagenome]